MINKTLEEYIKELQHLSKINKNDEFIELFKVFIAEHDLMNKVDKNIEELLKQAIFIDKNTPEFFELLTNEYRTTGRYNDLIDLKESIPQKLEYFFSFYCIGHAYHSLNDYKNAFLIFKKLEVLGYYDDVKNHDEFYFLLYPQKMDCIEIKKYHAVENIRIENLQDCNEIYFLGENGVGKTIILQSIITGLKQSDFEISKLGSKSSVWIKNYEHSLDYSYPNAFAYGTGRFRDSESIVAVDKTGYSTLFDRNKLLINPINWFKDVLLHETLNESQLKIDTILNFFTEIINFDNNTDFKIKREGSKFSFFEQNTLTEFNHLAEGYRSVLIWLSDLLSRLTENQPNINDLKDFHGIVLVDEIDMFLHPKWEYSIVKKLREKLPNIQWIFTTHSPMLILGASEDAVFYKVYKENGKTRISDQWHCKAIDNLLANAILTSPLFDMETARMRSFATSNKQLDTSEEYAQSRLGIKVAERLKEMKTTQSYISYSEIDEMIDSAIEELTEK